MIRVLNITTLYFPSQAEVCNSFSQEKGSFEYHLAFTHRYAAHRGKHWQSGIEVENEYIHIIDYDRDERYRTQWAVNLIKKISPTHLIFGRWRGRVVLEVGKFAKRQGIVCGYWMEPPNLLLPKWLQFVLEVYSWYRIRGADFVFAIGDRCERIYKKWVRDSNKVFLLTYGQDLLEFEKIAKTKGSCEKITFLFSGQLLKRHNIKWICYALELLYSRYKNQFKFILAASGPEGKYFEKLIRDFPEIQECIEYDREYKIWTDRVRPFDHADVLIYPTAHSGWGLVIPEAMSAGVVVLSTRKAEAARYYVRHDINGRFLQYSRESLIKEMEYCIQNPDEVRRWSIQARKDARVGKCEYVAKRFENLIRKV